MLSSILNVLLIAFGFGFVIFFHELGHFLAAKWADVKVEQFAVGFGQALLAWRKGLGARWGSTQPEYQQRLTDYVKEHRLAPRNGDAGKSTDEHVNYDETLDPTPLELARAAAALPISETEYRLNWIPLGGYVKMLGQDDLRPGASVSDPRAYNNVPISKRMVIVSAGVVMNVILAAIGFIIIFRIGYKVTPAVVGTVLPGSPAQHAYKIVDDKQVVCGLAPGDHILYLNNKYQSDFTKISLNTVLLDEHQAVPIYVRHIDGTTDHLMVEPAKSEGAGDFLMMGVTPPSELRGPDATDDVPAYDANLETPETRVIGVGDVITQIAGQDVKPDEFWKLDAAIQAAGGKPIPVTITQSDGKTRQAMLTPHFLPRFGKAPVDFAGLLMRPTVQFVGSSSPVKGKIKPGDVIVAFAETATGGKAIASPTTDELMTAVNDAGQRSIPVNITVERGGERVVVNDIKLQRIAPDRYGMGIGLAVDEEHPIVSGTLEKSPAADAGIPRGATITSIDGLPVSNWFDVYGVMRNLTPHEPVTLTALVDKTQKTFTLGQLSEDQIADITDNRLDVTSAALRPAEGIRKTDSLVTAIAWGVGETRDAVLQVYQTIRAMVHGSISVKEVSGPVGIVAVAYKVAQAGMLHLIWFLSIISANLAVMNFLPIPIVDGGLMTFLIIEKIKGSPISPRVQNITQAVGLALLLSVFLFATYQDVFNRLPFLFSH
jgi:regulator of sigma E protease